MGFRNALGAIPRFAGEFALNLANPQRVADAAAMERLKTQALLDYQNQMGVQSFLAEAENKRLAETMEAAKQADLLARNAEMTMQRYRTIADPNTTPAVRRLFFQEQFGPERMQQVQQTDPDLFQWAVSPQGAAEIAAAEKNAETARMNAITNQAIANRPSDFQERARWLATQAGLGPTDAADRLFPLPGQGAGQVDTPVDYFNAALRSLEAGQSKYDPLTRQVTAPGASTEQWKPIYDEALKRAGISPDALQQNQAATAAMNNYMTWFKGLAPADKAEARAQLQTSQAERQKMIQGGINPDKVLELIDSGAF